MNAARLESITQIRGILEQHNFDSADLEPAKAGLQNQVFLTPSVVIRYSKRTNHKREAQVALHALEHGVRTAKPLIWADHYSIYERVQGESLSADAEPHIWLELIKDLQRLHDYPFEPFLKIPKPWEGDLKQLETLFAMQLNPDERVLITAAFHRRLGSRFIFGHFDAFASNVMVNNDHYVALIDWGAADWGWLEREIAVLENAALELALSHFDVDWSLVWAMRLELFLIFGKFGRISIQAVRDILERM